MLLLKSEANSFTNNQTVWVSCGINREGILVAGSIGVRANMAAGRTGSSIFPPRSRGQYSNANLI